MPRVTLHTNAGAGRDQKRSQRDGGNVDVDKELKHVFWRRTTRPQPAWNPQHYPQEQNNTMRMPSATSALHLRGRTVTAAWKRLKQANPDPYRQNLNRGGGGGH